MSDRAGPGNLGDPNDAALAGLVIEAELAEAHEAAEAGNGGCVQGLWWSVIPGIAHSWAARVYAFDRPSATALAAAQAEVVVRARHHRVLTRAAHAEAGVFAAAGLGPVEPMPVFALDELRPPSPPARELVAEVRPARDAPEFLSVYGAELAPLVAPALPQHPEDFLVAVSPTGMVVGCARLSSMGRTVRVSAVTVRDDLRGQGIGSRLSYEACRRAVARGSDLVWLHSQARAIPVYERLGFRHLDDHVQLERQ